VKIKSIFILTGVMLSFAVSAQDSMSKGDFVVLTDPLDEPEFYCFDLAGWGDHLQLDDPLQTHTCKNRGADDQKFHFEGNRLKVSLYEGCVQAAGSAGTTLPGSAVLVRGCSDDNALQDLMLDDSGNMHLVGTEFCLGAGVDSRDASGPSHVWRTLAVVECATADPALSTWQVGLQ